MQGSWPENQGLMLVELLVFFGSATGLTTALVMLPGTVRARAALSAPLSIATVASAGLIASWLTNDPLAGTVLPGVAVVAVVGTRVWMRRWSLLGAEVFAMLALASAAFIAYAAAQTVRFAFNPAWALFSATLLFFEVVALVLATSYTFEMIDVLSRRRRADEAPPDPPATFYPGVGLQVPTYNEPVEVVRPTLESLAALDYPNYMVQVVDNNTSDPPLWRPLAQICRELGPRFEFIHLEDCPGDKAGALNEARRRLPQKVAVIGIVDPDYSDRP